MNISQSIKNALLEMPPGVVFGYQELPDYSQSPMTVIKAMNRLVDDKSVARLAKGKFYIPKKGLLGLRKPSDSELIRSILYKNGRLRGYVTGLLLFNQLGLTTQLPKTITVAINGGRQEIEFDTIKVKTVIAPLPIDENNVKLLQYLDVLKDIKKIPDADINLSLKIMQGWIKKLNPNQQEQIVLLARTYYSPQVRALLGLIVSALALEIADSLLKSLNPSTLYKLALDHTQWTQAKKWNIY
jgi:Family of unknown function (DUF6088)